MQLDPNIQNVILGVVSNVVFVFLTYSANTGIRLIRGVGHKRNRKKVPQGLESLLKTAINEVFEGIEWDGSDKASEICLFLATPEIENILMQIFSSVLTSNHSLTNIENEFKKLLVLHVDLSNKDIENISTALWNALILASNAALNVAIDQNSLPAHEARSVFRYQLLMDQISTIQRNVDFLTRNKKLDLQAILEFENEYRTQVATRHGYITPPFVDATKKIPIDDIYVSSFLVNTPNKKDVEPRMLQRKDFLLTLYRAVILGNPGGGKSTFTSKLCYDISTLYQKRLVAGRLLTPILVILRDYGTQKKERQTSILEFIERTANSHYQIRPPKGAFEYLLLNGRVFVIFDGLDELLDTSYRQEISNDVEVFCTRYPSVPVLVTSREVGYEQAPLDTKKFEIHRLAPFGTEQVQDYVTKWFAIESDLDSEQQKQQTKSFLRESQNVPDLRSNPLMLALMCNIYRGENYIPKNRPEIYQRCATMLFERWDKNRNIHVNLPFEEHIRPAMAYLAYWIYSEVTLQAGVTEQKLIEKTADYLIERRFEDKLEAENAARDFIEFCRGRAWVFTDTGTTAEGESLYQFTHQTFLEYFTADYLVRTRPTSKDLVDSLLSKIARREWDIVAQLTFQIHNRRLEGASNDLLGTLIEKSKDFRSEERWNILSFAVRCLEFIVPSPRITRIVTIAAIEQCLYSDIKGRSSKVQPKLEASYEVGAAEIIGYLLHAANENQSPIADSIEKTIIDVIINNDKYCELALELGLNLHVCLQYVATTLRHITSVPGPDLHPELLGYWNEISNRIYSVSKEKMLTLAPTKFTVCFELSEREEIDLLQFCEWHGIQAIFQGVYLRLLPSTRLSKAERIIRFLKRRHVLTDAKGGKIVRNLDQLGHIFLNSPTPWIWSPKLINLSRILWYIWEEERSIKNEQSAFETPILNNNALFAIFCILATISEVESISAKGARQRFDDSFELRIKRLIAFEYPLDILTNIVSLRFQATNDQAIELQIPEYDFSDQQLQFIKRWIVKEIDIVSYKNNSSSEDKQRNKSED